MRDYIDYLIWYSSQWPSMSNIKKNPIESNIDNE